ncbi:transmembrane ascorbate-dependent reductase CYB561 [Gambusia affinis]|uniref:transmembrane ascorbate-dependent reductase CYB561 n=1 Tax=Gambusia affinis TaxID=33528 RepID=UPI001CDB825F|nr:transmembrane ascorbate-dependent reductase CYB561 [Gambusia affinis]
MDDLSPRHGGSVFAGLVGASQVLGLVSVVLTGVWMGHYRGGFAWDGSAHEFNLHPLCMVLGLIFLHGDAILVYRVFCNEAKKHVKLLHGFIHLLALIISIVGVVAVFDFHRAAKIPDMYSLHSWCGMATLVFFCLQWVLGLLFFLFPVASSWLRATYLPIHVFCGLTLLVMAIGTSLLGITEKLLFSITDAYSLFAPEGVLANMLGILLLLYGVLLVYLITREEYRRPPNPEEESLSVHFKNLTEGGVPPTP